MFMYELYKSMFVKKTTQAVRTEYADFWNWHKIVQTKEFKTFRMTRDNVKEASKTHSEAMRTMSQGVSKMQTVSAAANEGTGEVSSRR